MAPEVVHSVNERTYSGKVDIWSVGCVVLEMWTGQRPWGELEQVAVMVQVSLSTSSELFADWYSCFRIERNHPFHPTFI